MRMNFIRTEYADRSVDVAVERTGQLDPILRFEGACLQLRQIIEMLIFSCLSANRELYSQEWTRFSREANFTKLTKRLAEVSQFDGWFLPMAVKYAKQPNGELNITGKKRQLDLKEITSCYGRLGNVLHARNPYNAEALVYPEMQHMHASMSQSLIRVLARHVAVLENGRILYVVMNKPEENVFCAVLQRKDIRNV